MKAVVRGLFLVVKPLCLDVGGGCRGACQRPAVSTSMMKVRWSDGQPVNLSSIDKLIQGRREGEQNMKSIGELGERSQDGIAA